MIKEGVLKNPDVDVILGQHVSPELLAGQVGIKAGMFMASADELYLDVKGVGGHAAIPKGSVNPLKISAEIISVLYKHFDNKENIILSLGAINGGTLGNIIPEQVSIKGTFRAMNEDKRFQAHKDIIEICQSIAKDLGGSCNVEIKVGYPFLKNHTDLTSFCKQNLNLFLEKENVIDISKRMTAEDFAFYSHYVPACFYRLGVGFDGEDARKLHHPNFDIDESALLTSVGVMSFLAISYLLQK
jgi:amidohydrolase